MSNYELVVIVDAHLPQEQKDAIQKEVSDAVAKAGGRATKSLVWFEKQKMSFPIKKTAEGTYFLFDIECHPSGIGAISTALRLNERILRSAIYVAEGQKVSDESGMR